MPLLGQFLDGLRGKLESVVARTAALDVTRLVHAFHEVQKSRHDDEHKASANRDLAAHISDDSAGLLIDLTAGAVEAKGAEEEGNREEADEADAGPQPLHRRNFQQLEESLRVLWGSMDLAHRAELHERIQRHVAGTHPEGGPRYLWPALLGSSYSVTQRQVQHHGPLFALAPILDSVRVFLLGHPLSLFTRIQVRRGCVVPALPGQVARCLGCG